MHHLLLPRWHMPKRSHFSAFVLLFMALLTHALLYTIFEREKNKFVSNHLVCVFWDREFCMLLLQKSCRNLITPTASTPNFGLKCFNFGNSMHFLRYVCSIWNAEKNVFFLCVCVLRFIPFSIFYFGISL